MLEPLAVEDAEQDLVLLGLAEEVGVHLVDPDPVRLDQVGRERVIGVDGDLVAGVDQDVGEASRTLASSSLAALLVKISRRGDAGATPSRSTR